MSSISLRGYISTAFEKGSGEVRLAKGTTDQLVNKGTFGNRVASFFQDAARAIGLMRPDPTRAQRQQSALEGFREALTRHFGAEAAQAGLQAAGLDVDGVALTGRAMIAATSNAKAAVAQNRTQNLLALDSFAPPGPGEDASAGFGRIAARMKPALDPSTLTAEQRLEFTTRLRDSVLAQSNVNRTALDGGQVEELAKDTLKQVLELSKVDGLDGAREAREAYTAALKDVLRGLASGKDASVLVTRLGDAVARFREHATAERTQEIGGGEFQELTDQALRRAMTELAAESPSLLAKAQRNALKDDSPLRALSIAAQETVATEGFKEGSEARTRREAAGRLFALGNMVVQGLANRLGSSTRSAGSDVDRVGDGESLSGRAKTAGMRALQELLDRVPIEPSMEEAFLGKIANDFAGHDENDFPDWHSRAVLHAVQDFLTEQVEELDRPLEVAIGELRTAIESDGALHPGLKAKLGAALDAVAEQASLHEKLGELPAFEGLKQEDVWRLFAVGRQQDEGISKWDLEHHGEGTLAGMQRAFGVMLQGLSDGVPLTAEHLEAIHVEGSRGTYRSQDLMLSYKSTIGDQPDLQEMFRENARVPEGFRGDGTNLTMRKGTETSEAGRLELAQLGEDDWFAGVEVRDEAVEITLAPKTPEQCRERTNAILATYREEIQDAETDDDKRLVIAKTVQDLYRSHVFMDGNTRSVVFTAMNRMLLENGLPPAILPEPKAAAGFSRAEFADEILRGQLAFAELS